LSAVEKRVDCPFCRESRAVISNQLAFVRYDRYPVSPGHCLVIPYRHIADYFDTTAEEKAAIWELVDGIKVQLDAEFKPDGYNVGVNVGTAAGQSVPHVHVHVIPRFRGDMDNPRGGVRGVIPHKQKYQVAS
jgi:diadenosine tetraphosphate (Ap4A) HIT family hydrolase